MPNDMFDEQARAEYAANLVHLAADVRAALKKPDLPVVIGELGNGGPEANANMIAIREAQAAAAAEIGPEGSAVFELTGGADLSVTSSTGGEVFYEHSAGSSRVVIVMDDPGQISFRVETGDVGVVPTVDVIQVADGQDQLRSSLSGYEVIVEGEKSTSAAEQGGRP